MDFINHSKIEKYENTMEYYLTLKKENKTVLCVLIRQCPMNMLTRKKKGTEHYSTNHLMLPLLALPQAT